MSSKLRFVRAAALGGVSILFFGATAHAQGQTTAQAGLGAAGEIENVVITGFLEQDLPQRLAELGTRVDVVSAGEIKNGGYLDVGQSLQSLVPGLYIAQKNGPFDYVDISLQGSRTDGILWTVDGVRINNRLYSNTSPIDTLPASMIERIEVLNGPQALWYGTQAIAGMINIVTKDFSTSPDGQVSIAGDTNSGRHLDGYFRDTLAGRHHFVVYGSADKSEGYQPFRTEDFQPSQTDRKRSYEVLTIGGKYAFDINDSIRLSVSEQHTDARLDFMYPQGARVAYNDRNEDILSAKVDYRMSDNLQFFLKGYYHWWYSYFTEFDNEIDGTGALTGNVLVSDDHDFWGFTDYGVNAMAKFLPTRGIETYVGYDYQNYGGNDVVLVIDKKTEQVHAVFAEIATNKDLFSNVQLAAGVRYNAPTMGPSATVWNATARWDINDFFYVKGMVGTAFRLPTAEELFANDPNDERGNPDTKPEKSTNINASIGGTLGVVGVPGISWEAIGFFRDIENLIGLVDFDPITNQDIFGNLPGKVRVRGGEFVVNAVFNPDLSSAFSYTYSSSHDSSGLQIRRVPEQLLKAAIDYHPANQPFGLFASINYVGRIFDTVGGERHEYGKYVVVDLGARAFLDSARHHRFDLNLFNVFDEEYTTRLTRGFPDNGDPAYLVGNLGLPRTLKISYTYSFF